MFINWINKWFEDYIISEEYENIFSFSKGWKNIRTAICLNQNKETVRIDIRLTFQDVTRENLVDFIDYYSLLDNQFTKAEAFYIVYLGNFNSEIPTNLVNDNFIIDKTCKKVVQYYINLNNDSTLKELIKANYSKEYNSIADIEPLRVLGSSVINGKCFGLWTKGVIKKDIPGKPLISIIIPSFNSESIIEQALQSAIVQTYANKEIIVIDGGSKDATASVVKKYEDYIDWFNSEPDKNIFDAINKGTLLSNGKYSVFIGSDDLLVYNALEKIVESFNAKGEKDFYYGDGITLTASGFLKKDTCYIKGKYFSDFQIYHPSLYIKKDTFIELNGFNIDFFISADADFELKLITNKKSYEKISNSLCIYRGGGHSSRFMWVKVKQVYKIYKQYNSLDVSYYLMTIRLLILMQVRKIFGKGFIDKLSVFKYRILRRGN